MPVRAAHLSLVLVLAGILLTGGRAWAGGPADHLAALSRLRAQFVAQMEEAEDAEEMSRVALSFAGRAWEIAARGLVERYPGPLSRGYLARIEAGPGGRPGGGQWAGLLRLHHSINAVAGIRASQRDRHFLSEVRAVERHLAQTFEPERHDVHALVSLTNATLALLALAVRAADVQEKHLSAVDLEMDLRVDQARAIQAREDIDPRRKLLFLAANNIHGCFELVYLFNLVLDERLAREVNLIREALEEQAGEADPPERALVLGLTALAEASFPLARALVAGG